LSKVVWSTLCDPGVGTKNSHGVGIEHHPLSPWQCTLLPTPLLDSPPLTGIPQDLSTHRPGRPKSHSIYRDISLSPPLLPWVTAPLLTSPAFSPDHSLIYKSYQLPAPPAKFQVSKSHLLALSSWNPFCGPFHSSHLEWPGCGFLHIWSVLLCLSFSQEGRLGILTVPHELFNSVPSSGSGGN
jgi:hypothetical protein